MKTESGGYLPQRRFWWIFWIYFYTIRDGTLVRLSYPTVDSAERFIQERSAIPDGQIVRTYDRHGNRRRGE